MKATIQIDGLPQAFSKFPDYPEDGTQLGKYRDLKSAGQGGFSKVFRAYDPDLDRWVAVKVLKKGTFASEDLQKMFRHEIQTQAKLDLPGIVRIFECGEDKGWLFYTMEFVEGDTIDKYVKDRNLPIANRVALIIRLASIIDKLHRQGLRHRDIKPRNVMVDAHGEIKLLDFGLVKNILSGKDILQTQTGIVSGTPAYMAPEQALKNKDAASLEAADVYSLGVLAYEILTDKLPYDIEFLSTEEATTVIESEPPAPMCDSNPEISPELEACVFRALSKNASDRPTAGQFADDLEKVINPPPPTKIIPATESTAKSSELPSQKMPSNKGGLSFWPALFALIVLIAGIIACYFIFFAASGSKGGQQSAAGYVAPNTPPPEPVSEKLPDAASSNSKANDRNDSANNIEVKLPAQISRNPDEVKLYVNSSPDEFTKEWKKKTYELADNTNFKGKGALIYYLPEKAIMKVIDSNGVLFKVESPITRSGCFYVHQGKSLTIELRLTSGTMESKTFKWTPKSGQVDVFY